MYPIPSTRASSLLIQRRALVEVNRQQLDVLRAQTRVSSGLRLAAPSDDPIPAQRAIGLQRLLEQKEQVQVNLRASQSYFNATDNALQGVSEMLSQARGLAIRAADSSTSATERDIIATDIGQTARQLLDVANERFRGRYLFGGSETHATPYATEGEVIAFSANDVAFSSFADVDLLVESNVSAQQVFGALSARVEGAAVLTPVLSNDTRLADLHGGRGARLGAIVVSDGFDSRTIDLSGAETIGDVVRLLEANPPAGRDLRARLVGQRLEIAIDAAGGGNLQIRDVAGGKTALDLGVREENGVGVRTLVGDDLAPRVGPTTRLDDLFGARASAVLGQAGGNNDLLFTARARGAEFNGFAVRFVDDDLLHAAPGLSAGNEFAVYSAAPVAARASLALSGANNDLLLTAVAPGAAANNTRVVLQTAAGLGDAAQASFDAFSNTLTLVVDDADQTRLGTLVSVIDGTGLFTAAGDPSAGDGFDANALVLASDAGVATADTGNSGGDANTIFVHVEPGATTTNQALAALRANADITALFDVALEAKDSDSAALAGQGLVDVNASATTADGAGAEFDAASGLRITQGDATHLVSLASARTVEDVLNLLNGSTARVLAEINAAGTGINVRSRLAGVDFSVGENGGATATQLGVRSLVGDTPLGVLQHGRGVRTRDGADFLIRRSDGVELAIDLAGAHTVADVLARVNEHPDNLDPANRVTATLRALGNGIELREAQPDPAGRLTVERLLGGDAALDLGLLSAGVSEAVAVDDSAGGQTLVGADPHPLEAAGVFNTLLRMRRALAEGDDRELERVAELLNDDIRRLNFARSEVGARGRSLDDLRARLDTEDVELRTALSNEIDTDHVEAISDLAARQASLEASLKVIAQAYQLSLMDFI